MQACIPKDPAAIWNTEFVQAEELFKQPSAFDDCLRDGRYYDTCDTLYLLLRFRVRELICSS